MELYWHEATALLLRYCCVIELKARFFYFVLARFYFYFCASDFFDFDFIRWKPTGTWPRDRCGRAQLVLRHLVLPSICNLLLRSIRTSKASRPRRTPGTACACPPSRTSSSGHLSGSTCPASQSLGKPRARQRPPLSSSDALLLLLFFWDHQLLYDTFQPFSRIFIFFL